MHLFRVLPSLTKCPESTGPHETRMLVLEEGQSTPGQPVALEEDKAFILCLLADRPG